MIYTCMDKYVFENIHTYMHRASSIETRTEGSAGINEDPSDIPPELDRFPHLLQVAHDTAYEIDRIFTGDDVAKLFVAALWFCLRIVANSDTATTRAFAISSAACCKPAPRASFDNIY